MQDILDAMSKTTCPKCQGKGIRCNWRPPRGINPHLRQYECSDCHHIFYAETGLDPLIIAKEAINSPGKKQEYGQASF